jgi:hypothetical protein
MGRLRTANYIHLSRSPGMRVLPDAGLLLRASCFRRRANWTAVSRTASAVRTFSGHVSAAPRLLPCRLPFQQLLNVAMNHLNNLYELVTPTLR